MSDGNLNIVGCFRSKDRTRGLLVKIIIERGCTYKTRSAETWKSINCLNGKRSISRMVGVDKRGGKGIQDKRSESCFMYF